MAAEIDLFCSWLAFHVLLQYNALTSRCLAFPFIAVTPVCRIFVHPADINVNRGGGASLAMLRRESGRYPDSPRNGGGRWSCTAFSPSSTCNDMDRRLHKGEQKCS